MLCLITEHIPIIHDRRILEILNLILKSYIRTKKKIGTHGVHVLARSWCLRTCCSVNLGKGDFLRINTGQVCVAQ